MPAPQTLASARQKPTRSPWRPAVALALAVVLGGCGALGSAPHAEPLRWATAAWPDALAAVLPADVLLLGEQHDAPDHQLLQREAVQWLAARGQLAAVVLEMAESGHGTQALAPDATEAQVQAALHWNDTAWPWQAYGPVVMAAVAAGVPVLGGNLPRARMRAAMGEAAWDQHLPAPALQRQYTALREGHCGLLPESQMAPMARIQIARDASLARTAQQALRPGQTVLLIAGGGHVLRDRGVPTHWPADLRSKVLLAQAGQAQAAIKTEVDAVVQTPALAPQDHCAALRERWRQGGRPGG